VQLAFQAQQDMAFLAPVVGQIARRVFDHTHAQRTELAGAPVGYTGFAGMFGRFDLAPIGDAKGDIADVHRMALQSKGGY